GYIRVLLWLDLDFAKTRFQDLVAHAVQDLVVRSKKQLSDLDLRAGWPTKYRCDGLIDGPFEGRPFIARASFRPEHGELSPSRCEFGRATRLFTAAALSV